MEGVCGCGHLGLLVDLDETVAVAVGPETLGQRYGLVWVVP